MNITIKRLELTNFKCFRHKEFTFDSDVTTIRGRNGVGKTTIADAILWCLFGKNSQGQSDFDLKTHDENGRPIPNLDHSVEMVLETRNCESYIEGLNVNTITLKRTLKETWIKKRGSEEQVFKNNTTEYLVNGDSYTAADYKKYIASLVSEEVFRCITNPSYFPSLKWQEQRQFLTALVDMSDAATPTKDELDGALAEIAPNQSLIDYLKHLSYQIKQLKDRLKNIPVRLEEQNKALPEKLDWDELLIEYDKTIADAKEIDGKIVAIKSGNGQDIKKDELRKELDRLYTIKRLHEDEVRQFEQAGKGQKEDKISELSRKFNSLLNDQHDLENSIKSFETLIARCKETAEATFKSEQAYVREHWKETQIEFNDSEAMCPYCHQYLPEEMLAEAKAKFNQHKAELKQQLTERAAKAKQLLADAEVQAKEYEEKKADAETNLASIKDDINTTFAEKAKLEKEKAALPTYDQILGENEEYQIVLETIKSKEKEVQDASVSSEEDNDQLTELESTKMRIEAEISNYSTQLASRSQYDKITALIDGIKEEEKDLVKQLSELERKEDVARRYQDRQNQILEDRINEHFSMVKWKMFRTVNNGGDPHDEPYCECYVDGVAYHDGLNQAARLNAGLDIIQTLCRHYQVLAPIVIDNSESNLNILHTDSQQIRLEVFDSELQVV